MVSKHTFGESLGGVSLHAEVVDQHDGQMLLDIPRDKVTCTTHQCYIP